MNDFAAIGQCLGRRGWLQVPLVLVLVAVLHFGTIADDPPQDAVYSGPQVGEPLPPLRIRAALGEDAGRDLEAVPSDVRTPTLIVFIHDVNRPVIAFTRALTRYAHSRREDGLQTAVVLLGDDATAAQAALQRMQHAMTREVLTGVALEGREGPGAYGLNRLVQLTVLVANEGRITANFALVQPSLQADLPRIAESIVKQIGGPTPTVESLLEGERMGMGRKESDASNAVDPERMRSLLRPLIDKEATSEQVVEAARVVEAAIADDPAIRNEIGRIASTILRSGKLANYGTPRAQEVIRAWAKTYGEVPDQGSRQP